MIILFHIILFHSTILNNEPLKSSFFSKSASKQDFNKFCFYSFSKRKCPKNIPKSNILGPGQYNSKIFFFSQKSVKILIVENISLSNPLILSAPVNFYISGYSINGKIEAHTRTSIFIEDSSKTEFILNWSVASKEISNLNTLSKPESIFIQISGFNQSLQYNLPFYTGKPTKISLSHLKKDNIQYSIIFSDKKYHVRVHILNNKSLKSTDSGKLSDKVTYLFSNSILKIEGNDGIPDYSDSYPAPWYSYRKTIEYIEIAQGITKIGDHSFSDLTNLKTIILPTTLSILGEYSFCNCYDLNEISIPESVDFIGNHCFAYCHSLIYIKIPPNIECIPAYSFYKCKSLVGIDFPDKINEFGSSCFAECSSLISIEIPRSITELPDHSFHYCYDLFNITFPDSLTKIGDFTFKECSSLIEIKLPQSLTSIGDFSFFNCSQLKIAKLSKNVQKIGCGSFSFCLNLINFEIDENNPNYKVENNAIVSKDGSNLVVYLVSQDNTTTYTISGSIHFINDYSFYYSKLETIIIPEGVTTIGTGCFCCCFYLTNIKTPNSVTEIGSYCFCNCTSLEYIDIAHCSKIAEYMFYKCYNLSRFTIPSEVKVIERYAFYSCSFMISIDFSPNLESIGDYAFYSCRRLQKLAIPASVTSIGDRAFDLCTYLLRVYIISNNANYYSENNALYDNQDNLIVLANSHDFELSPNVTTIKPYTFYHKNIGETITIPEGLYEIEHNAFEHCDSLGYLTLSDTVEIIGDYAFANCERLKTIRLGRNLKSIGKGAFQKCSTLDLIVFYDNVEIISEEAFSWCYSLTYLDIPYSVKTLGKFAFNYCYGLETVRIPNSDLQITGAVFTNCSKLTTIKVDQWNMNYKILDGVLLSKNETCLILYPSNKRAKNYTIPNSVKYILDYSFYNCSQLSYLTINESVEFIGSYSIGHNIKVDFHNNVKYMGDFAFSKSSINSVELQSDNFGKFCFSSCNYLKVATISSGVTTIKEGMFYNCNNLENITIADTVTTIESSAFEYCSSLTTIKLPSNLQYLGDSSFSKCEILAEVNIPESLTFISDYLFQYTRIESIVLPETILSIGCFSFGYIYSLKTINLPSNLRSIGNGAFYECENLQDVNLPQKLTVISMSAFQYTLSLTNIELPLNISALGKSSFNMSNIMRVGMHENIRYLGNQCFNDCLRLKKITFLGITEPKYGNNTIRTDRNINVCVNQNYTQDSFCGISPIYINKYNDGVYEINNYYDPDYMLSDDYLNETNSTEYITCPIYRCYKCYSEKDSKCDICGKDNNDQYQCNKKIQRKHINYKHLNRFVQQEYVYKNRYIFNANMYSEPSDDQIIVLRLEPESGINKIVINNQPYYNIGIDVSKMKGNMTIKARKRHLMHVYIFIGENNDINFTFDEYVRPSFKQVKGNIYINSIKEAYIQEIEPCESCKVTVIPLSRFISIYSVDFIANDVKFSIDQQFFYIDYIYMMQIADNIKGYIYNFSLHSTYIRLGLNSSLLVDETINFRSCTIDYFYNNSFRQSKSYITGKISNLGIPESFGLINTDAQNSVKTKILMAESKVKFFCNLWGFNSRSTIKNYWCVKEKENGMDLFRMYGETFSKDNKKVKKKSLSSTIIVLIVIGCGFFVVLVASIVLYCCVIQKKYEAD